MKKAILARSEIKEDAIYVSYPSSKIHSSNKLFQDFHNSEYNKENKVKFIFTGSIYSSDVIHSFIEALALLDFKLNGKEIIFEIVAKEGVENVKLALPTLTKHKGRIFVSPPVTVEEASLAIANADVAFLPYTFNHDILTSQAFPSKLSTYLSSAKNLFVISPENSSLNIFLKENGLGVGFLSSNEPEEIASEIIKLFTDSNLSAQRSNMDRIYLETFSVEMYQKILEKAFSEKSFGAPRKIQWLN
ncbi:MAG: hypothetical protein WCR21_07915, partial [Bacteroidota bacterium]